jgi:hypothetical protein
MADNTEIKAQHPLSFLSREPVAIMAIIRSGLAMAVGFGLQLEPEQIATIIVFTEAILALITRQQVTPFVATGTTPRVADAAQTPLIAPAVAEVAPIDPTIEDKPVG